MKKIIIGAIFAIFLTCGFAVAGFWKHQSADSIPFLVNPDIIAIGETPSQDSSIYSSSRIISLSLVVIGIVAFRRNTQY